MENLNENLRNMFYYDTETNAYIRKNRIRSTNNFHEEFKHVFNTQYGDFNTEDFIVDSILMNEDDEDDDEDMYDGNYKQCACGHEIKNLYFIRHKQTDEKWQVGSKCVERIFPHMHKIMNELRKKAIYKLQGRVCNYCEEPLMDRRKKYPKLGYCDMNCLRKNNYIMKFGRYKGQILMEVLYTREGFNYYQWIKNTIAQDEFAFNSYPLFLEIINEIELNNVEEE